MECIYTSFYQACTSEVNFWIDPTQWSILRTAEQPQSIGNSLVTFGWTYTISAFQDCIIPGPYVLSTIRLH